MYSSPSSTVTKRVILIQVLAIQLLLINSELPLNTTTAYINHKCLVSQGKYKPGSEYEKEFESTMQTIYKRSYAGFFYYGDPTVTGIIQCRGDSYGLKCRDCFATALAALRRRCPWYKGRIIWYDQCLLSIDVNRSIGKIDYDLGFCISNAKKFGGNRTALRIAWNTLMYRLTSLAVDDSNSLTPLYSAGEMQFKGEMLYGMVQCTIDLVQKACKECIQYNGVHFQDCLSDKRGARFVSRSCTFRFEFYPFVANRTKIFKELNK